MRAAVTALIITIINPAGVANPAVGNAAAITAAQDTPPAPPLGIQLADAPASEAEALNRLATARSWPLRALAAMRLERFDCEASAGRLATLSQDASWRVRAYAYACLARRGVAVPPERLAAEADPRVLRTILRARYPMPLPAIDARISRLEQPGSPFDAMLALECLAALDRADDKPIRERMDDLLSRIVLRMDRPQGGVLSPRLAAVTAGDDSGRNYRWREWYRKSKARPGYEPAALVPAAAEGVRQVARNKVADLEPERFVAFEGYLTSVADRPMDLAILIDCTASMSRELADAQGGIDDLVDFLGSVTKGVRIGIVGYRDKTDDWETRGWDFTGSVDEARTRLWSLAAEGGGDTPESVHAAMKLALTRFSWLPDAAANAPQPIRAAVLVGDAPPHPGEGALCIDMAKRAAARGLRLYGIVARESETNLKPEAAEGDDNRRDDRRDNNDTAQPATDPTTPDPTTPDPTTPDPTTPGPTTPGPTTPGPPTTPRRDPAQVEPPKPPPPTMKRRQSFTLFPEIAEAGGGRADILKDKDSLIAEIAELTIADKYREEFADFFAAFRLLCR